MSHKNNVITYLIFSLIGILILVVAILFSYSPNDSIDLFDRMFVGGAFITSCLLGLSLAVRPNWIRRMNKNSKGLMGSGNTKMTRKRRGHHPDCIGFSSHVIKTNRKTHCAGCLGLAFGSVASIILIGLYIIVPLEANVIIYVFLLLIGLFLIGSNYLEVILPNKSSYMHLALNSLLVIGFLLVVISVFSLTANVTYGILAVILSFLWLDTRIQLSMWNHRKICLDCHDSCKVY